ncbi:MAG: DUF2029 domain-containing protein [Candidatus Omnitrophica bacterium]|nr:DUF2029 domain-containing protein [Candidatus Omnitrophota bacterium]
MMHTNRKFLKVSLIFLIFYIFTAGYYFNRVYQPWGTCDTDFSVFVRAAKSMAQKEDIYERSYLETGKDYYKYSPAFALSMIPLSKLHMHLSVPIWFLLIYIFFISSICLVKKLLEAENSKKILSKTFFFFAILMSLRFLLSVVQRVQSDCLVLILLAVFVFALFYRKDASAGCALATATMVKLTPLIFLPYLILRKKFKAAAATLFFILLYLWLPALYLGTGKNMELIKSWFLVHKTNPADYIYWFKNQSLLGATSRLLTKNTPVGLLDLDQATVNTIFILVACILFALIFICLKQRGQQDRPLYYLTDISLVLICMILFSPLGWKHTFIHLLIPHMTLLYYLMYVDPKDKIIKALVIASFFINTMLNPELTGPFSKTIQLYSNVTFGTLCLYAALLRMGCKYEDLGNHSHI